MLSTGIAASSIVGRMESLIEYCRRCPSKSDVALAGSVITLVFAESGFAARIVPAFRNIVVQSSGESDLTVLVVSRKSFNELDAIFDQGVRFFSGHPNETLVSSKEGLQLVLQTSPLSLSIINLSKRFAVYVIDGPESLTDLERGNPLKQILSAYFCDQDFLILHAAAVATERGTALIAGRSASGKSTISAACLESGWKFLSDDTTLCSRSGTIYGVYNTLKLEAAQASRFSILSTCDALRGDVNKSVFFVAGDSHLTTPPARALVFPAVSCEARTTIDGITRGEALRRLLSSSLFFLPVTQSRTTVNMLANLARQLPSYKLTVGQNPLEAPEVIASVLE